MDRIAPLADLRNAADLRAAALALNTAHERETGPLDSTGLDALLTMAFAAPAVRDEHAGVSAFMIALAPGAAYASPNYRWVSAQLTAFVYVDRIVVAQQARGRGLGRQLYDVIEGAARRAGLVRLACEVNLDPPNPASMAFHTALGFTEIGRATLAGSGKTVAYLARELAA